MKIIIKSLKVNIILIIALSILCSKLNSFSLKKITLKKPYSTLSCKVDSLYYALQYYIVDLEKIEWFINKIPVKQTKYLKTNKDVAYTISDPLKYILGSINGQQARFSYYKELKILHNNKLVNVYYDKDNYIDVKKNYDKYQKIISFGIDTRLLIYTFSEYFKNNNIKVNFFYLEEPIIENVINIFINELISDRAIICNGITDGYKDPRVFNFKISGSKEIYRWKEASHSYVIIGYNLKKRIFIAADNYGDIKDPYKPKFRNISFERVYNEITLIDKNKLDYSYSIGKNNLK